MRLSLASSSVPTDVLFLVLAKGEKLSPLHKKALGMKTVHHVETRLKSKDFEGEDGQLLRLFPEEKKWKSVVLVGRGERGKELPQALEFLGGKIADVIKSAKAESASVWAEEKDLKPLAYGLVLGHYEFTRYKTPEKKEKPLKEVILIAKTNKENKEWVEQANIFVKCSSFVRDLVNRCSGNLNPQDLAEEAKALGKKYKMKVTVFDDKKLKKLGCGAIYGVGQGARVGSRMVFVEYRYKSKAKVPCLAFIGKGISFDSGGLNLKPSGHIEDMKLDMAGAASVLGTLMACAENKIPGYFLGVMACAENAVSDRSLHPGDVVKAYNGKTIEVTNTDAEGRLVLADALSYTEKNYKPECMVDLATLTGAVTVALGYHITGVMGNKQKFIDEMMEISHKTGERFWPLPLDEDFVKACKGTFSDLKNATDGVRAGTIMGAAFLKCFVEKTPWVHLDIAGSAWAEKPTPTTKYGATAANLRTLIELAKKVGSRP